VGAAVHGGVPHVQEPGSEDERDPDWRPWNRTTDDPGRLPKSVGYGESYPADMTTLYYWRTTYYWRKSLRGNKVQ
jgi:hypothetical protein